VSKKKFNMPTNQRPTWAEIDIHNLATNFQSIKKRIAPATKIMAVVKANAYGHGAVACAQLLATEGADWFGVALPEEGVELRLAGIQQPILCLGGFWHDQANLCVQHKITPIVYSVEMIRALNQAAMAAGIVADVHVKVDTGMGRLGVRFDQWNDFVTAIAQFKNIRVDGVLTHFAAADDASCQPLTHDQIRRFNDAVSMIHQHGHQPSHLHLANSAAIYSEQQSWGNMVRPGGVLYGLWRDVLPLSVGDPDLLPVMSVHSQITLLKWVPPGETIGYGCTFEASRRSLIATIPIGYHDGYMRGLSNRSHVIIRQSYAPVVGRVSMDLTLVDVTGIEGVQVNDKVTLLGPDKRGSELNVTAEDLARIVGTLSYEVTCGVSARVPRIYVD
jgi:alanine racemase